MAKLDAVKAAVSGFRLIGKNPGAVIVWALFLGIVGILPVFALMGGVITSVITMAMADEHGAEITPQMVLPILGSAIALLPVILLTGLLVRAVLTGAIFRAVLMPRDSGWFYLRLGARELWLALLSIVLGILGGIVGMVCMAAVAPLMMISVSMDDHLVQLAVTRLMLLPIYAVMAFLVVRFGMSLPMTFDQSQFRLFESWNFTRGNGWRIFLMLIIMVALAILSEIVLGGLIVAVLFAVLGTHLATGSFSEDHFKELIAQDPSVWLQTALPWVIGIGLFASLIGAFFAVIFTAPFAEAYRQIRDGGSSPLSEPASDALAA